VRPHRRGSAPDHTHHHRDVTSGQARAAVFGISDGLVSNVSLVLGVAGSGADASIVRVTGLAGLVAGAVSMAAGEWNSMKAQQELLQRELELERRELLRNPEGERRELAAIYEARGVRRAQARAMAEELMRDTDVALETHAREELGINPHELGSPLGAAFWSFLFFALGALVPILPWFAGSGDAARAASLALGIVAAVLVGTALARLTERSPLRQALRQAGVLVAASAVTTAIGSAVGSGA